MNRLHYFPPMCSLASMTALELAGADYEPVLHDMAGDRVALKAVSPIGKIPVLETDDGPITDTLAIIFWIAQQYPDARLLPTDPTGLTAALSKMAWLGSHLHIVRRRYFRPELFGAPDGAVAQMREAARPIYWQSLKQVDAWIAKDELGGGGIEAYALLFYHWAAIDRLPVTDLTNFTVLVSRLCDVEGVRRALSLHASPLLTETAWRSP